MRKISLFLLFSTLFSLSNAQNTVSVESQIATCKLKLKDIAQLVEKNDFYAADKVLTETKDIFFSNHLVNDSIRKKILRYMTIVEFGLKDVKREEERQVYLANQAVALEKKLFWDRTQLLYSQMYQARIAGDLNLVVSLWKSFLKEYPKLDDWKIRQELYKDNPGLDNANLMIVGIDMNERDRVNAIVKKDEPKTISNLRINDVSSIGNTIYGRTWASSDGLKFSYDYSSIANSTCMIIWNKNTTKTNPAGVFINVEFKPMYGKCQIAGMSAEDGGSFFLYIFPDGHIERQSGERMELQ